jgi:hypothetical protein
LGVGLNLPSANPQLDQVNFVPECWTVLLTVLR